MGKQAETHKATRGRARPGARGLRVTRCELRVAGCGLRVAGSCGQKRQEKRRVLVAATGSVGSGQWAIGQLGGQWTAGGGQPRHPRAVYSGQGGLWAVAVAVGVGVGAGGGQCLIVQYCSGCGDGSDCSRWSAGRRGSRPSAQRHRCQKHRSDRMPPGSTKYNNRVEQMVEWKDGSQ